MYRHWAGNLARQEGRHETAIDVLGPLTEQFPLAARFHRDYAQALLAHGDNDAALASICQARALLPFDERYAVLEAVCLVAKGEGTNATELLEERVSTFQAGKYAFAVLKGLYSKTWLAKEARCTVDLAKARFSAFKSRVVKPKLACA